MSSPQLRLFALPGLPEVHPGDDLGALIVAGLAAAAETLQTGDVVVIAQKIVSKAEGRLVTLDSVQPSTTARELAAPRDLDGRADTHGRAVGFDYRDAHSLAARQLGGEARDFLELEQHPLPALGLPGLITRCQQQPVEGFGSWL